MNEKNSVNKQDSLWVARKAAMILIEKKAINVTMFDVKDTSSVNDYYVNATGRSSTNVSALADEVDMILSKEGVPPLRVEGRRGQSWILVDFGDVIVNVFDRASRDFYNFDRHLPEGAEVDISDIVAEVDKKFDIIEN